MCEALPLLSREKELLGTFLRESGAKDVQACLQGCTFLISFAFFPICSPFFEKRNIPRKTEETYGNWKTEQVATKFAAFPWKLDRQDVVKACKGSLERLGHSHALCERWNRQETDENLQRKSKMILTIFGIRRNFGPFLLESPFLAIVFRSKAFCSHPDNPGISGMDSIDIYQIHFPSALCLHVSLLFLLRVEPLTPAKDGVLELMLSLEHSATVYFFQSNISPANQYNINIISI